MRLAGWVPRTLRGDASDLREEQALRQLECCRS